MESDCNHMFDLFEKNDEEKHSSSTLLNQYVIYMCIKNLLVLNLPLHIIGDI